MPFLGTTGGASVKQYGGQANLGYFIKNSLRLRSSASANLSKTLTTPTNNQKWTYSVWFKRGSLSNVSQGLFEAPSSGSTFASIYLTSTDIINWYDASGGATVYILQTTQVFRDPSAWYHLVCAYDSTQATESNRQKMYLNGVQITALTATYVGQNVNGRINSAVAHKIGTMDAGSSYYDGYIGEINFIDGQQLTPSSFGKTDAATGQWIPKKFAGTYGTNGFYLKFADTSGITAATIGKDSSGNGNNWTPSGISNTTGATYDFMIDSPTLSGAASNYAVMNPLDKTSVATVSNGNLKVVSTAGGFGLTRATMAIPSTGKFYFEVTFDAGTTDDSTWVGVIDSSVSSVFLLDGQDHQQLGSM
jgi:hypothetical protein